MQWIVQTEKDAGSTALERHLWDAADQSCANSGLNLSFTIASAANLF